MEYLDLALRGATIALLALLGILMMRSRIGLEGRLAILAVGATKSAFLLVTTALTLPFPQPLASNLTLLASLLPLALTALIVTIFVDPPGRRWPWFLASVLVSVAFYAHFLRPEFGAVCAIMAVPLYGALLILSIWSARDDLVECRCRARPAFAAAIAGLALLFTALQALDASVTLMPAFALLKSSTSLAVAFSFGIWILQPNLDLWPGQQDAKQTARPQAEVPQTDNGLLARIEDAMQNGIWREEGLTIGALAARLDVPEHRLRRAINQGLGYRNFSSFINSARIQAARNALRDPEEFGTTVLEIAYRVGFSSLGPFNRAFRAETSMSPTEYRRQEPPRPPVDSENNPPFSANLH